MRLDNYRGWDDEALPTLGATGNGADSAPAPALPILPTFDATTILGVDLSHFQGDVDFAKLKAAGCEFVFIKATEGSTIVDAKFSQFWQAAKAAGIPRGAYHFFRAKSDLQTQIDNFCNTVGRLESGDLPPVLDVEAPEDWTSFTVAQRVAMVLGWLKAVETKLGVRPIIYINNPMATSTLGSPAAFSAYVLWVAHYTSRPAPSVPAPWTTWTFWQYYEHGTIAGVTGEVDLNRFAGTVLDLQRLRHFAVSAESIKPAPAASSQAVSRGSRIGRRIAGWFRRLFGCGCH